MAPALAVALLLGASPVWAQEDKSAAEALAEEQARLEQEYAADKAALKKWFGEWKQGEHRLISHGLPDTAAIAGVDQMFGKVAKWNKLEAARMLFDIATTAIQAPGGGDSSMAKLDYYSELQVWKVRGLARNHIARMTGEGIDDWLLEFARQRVSADSLKDVATTAGAALQILGDRKNDKAIETMLVAAKHTKPEIRVQAVNALSKGASLKTVSIFIDLLRDAEPNVRIAALTAIGKALQPHTDETIHRTVDPELAKLRDQVVSKVGALLGHEKVWQVRVAGRECLVALRSKVVIPVLIEALKAELRRKKDPWALDVALHHALENLTGQTMVANQTDLWEQFWKQEGGSFAFAPKGQPATASTDDKTTKRYSKFFKLNIESDRILFVVDFSGSMAEPATLKSMGTASFKRGEKTTKAKLVVAEMRSLIMALPDDTLFNIVVFSEDVRIWRSKGSRPALVKLNDESRDDLLGSFLDSLHPRGKTNLYGALDKAFDFGGRGLYDKYYAAGFDTLYVLSDGAPTCGTITDTEEILRQVRENNRLKKITVHTITFGDKNEMRFLKKLAEQNGGRHIHVE